MYIKCKRIGLQYFIKISSNDYHPNLVLLSILCPNAETISPISVEENLQIVH